MKNRQVDLHIQSENGSFVVREEKISRIYIVFPLFRENVSVRLKKDFLPTLSFYDEAANTTVYEKGNIISVYSLNPISKQVTIFLPQNTLHDIDASLENGNITLQKINANSIKLNLLRGNAKIKDSNISSLKVDGITSNMEVVNSVGNDYSLTTKTGNIYIHGSSPISCVLGTMIGDIAVNLKDDEKEKAKIDINAKRVDGSISLLGKNYEKHLYCIAPHGRVLGNIYK